MHKKKWEQGKARTESMRGQRIWVKQDSRDRDMVNRAREIERRMGDVHREKDWGDMH